MAPEVVTPMLRWLVGEGSAGEVPGREAMASIIRIAVAAAILCGTVAIATGAGTLAASPCQGAWVQGEPPMVGTYVSLDGVSVLSPCNAWAVGQSSVGTVAEQWIGNRWIAI